MSGRIVMALLAALPLVGCGSGDAGQAQEPSVRVGVVTPQRGSLPALITAFGSATPSTAGAETLSIAQPGQVSSLAVTAGSAVRAGQPLLVFAVQPSALSGYEAAVTTLTAATKQRDTTAQLLSQQLATRDQLTQADKAVADARAALAALRREGAGEPVQTLRAPFDGVVTALPVAQGDRTQPGAALVTVARSGGIVVTVGVDPADRAHIRAGAAARLARLNGGAPIAGKVLRVDGQLNATTRLVDVDIGFPAGAILVGEALRVDITTGESAGWVVPHAAVVTTGDGAHVFQVAGGKAKSVPVTLVQAGPQEDVVSGAIDPAKPLIVEGAYQVEDGGAVRQESR